MHNSLLHCRRRGLTNFAIRILTFVCVGGAWNGSYCQQVVAQDSVPKTAVRQEGLSNASVEVFRQGDRLFLSIQAAGSEAKRVSLPRLYASVRRWGWSGNPDSKINLIPEPGEWTLEWTQNLPDTKVIELELESAPVSLEHPPVIAATADGSIWLAAHQARTGGTRLRYEPQPYKNTVGYWADAGDFAAWDFQIERPGLFAVAILQGCGAGQGGSDAEITVRQENSEVANLAFEVEETGHFQNFRWRTIGHIELKNVGRHELKLAAVKIANAALVDVRAVHLVRQASAEK